MQKRTRKRLARRRTRTARSGQAKPDPMIHWTPAPLTAVAGERTAIALPETALMSRGARGDHARMLSHAAQRRLRAKGEDRDYWLAGAPVALAQAATLTA